MRGTRCGDRVRRGVARIRTEMGSRAPRTGKGNGPKIVADLCMCSSLSRLEYGFKIILTESMIHLGCIWESLNYNLVRYSRSYLLDTHVVRIKWLIHVKHLERCLAHNKQSMNRVAVVLLFTTTIIIIFIIIIFIFKSLQYASIIYTHTYVYTYVHIYIHTLYT